MGNRKRKKHSKHKHKPRSTKGPSNVQSPVVQKVVLVVSLTFIVVSLYLGLRDATLRTEQLVKMEVTLQDEPLYLEEKWKTRTYRKVLFTAEEFQGKFVLSGKEYESANHVDIKALAAEEQVSLFILKSKTEDLSERSFQTNIYGILHDGYNLIDLEHRNHLKKLDQRYMFVFTFIGLIMLPYAFIQRPKIGMDKAVYGFALLVLIYLLVG